MASSSISHRSKALGVEAWEAKRLTTDRAFFLLAWVVLISSTVKLCHHPATYSSMALVFLIAPGSYLLPLSLLRPRLYLKHRALFSLLTRLGSVFTTDMVADAILLAKQHDKEPQMWSYSALGLFFWHVAMPSPRYHTEGLVLAQLLWRHRTLFWPSWDQEPAKLMGIAAVQILFGFVVPIFANRYQTAGLAPPPRAARVAGCARVAGGAAEPDTPAAGPSGPAELVSYPAVLDDGEEDGYTPAFSSSRFEFGFKLEGVSLQDVTRDRIATLAARLEKRGGAMYDRRVAVGLEVREGCVMIVAEAWAEPPHPSLPWEAIALGPDTPSDLLSLLPEPIQPLVTSATASLALSVLELRPEADYLELGRSTRLAIRIGGAGAAGAIPRGTARLAAWWGTDPKRHILEIAQWTPEGLEAIVNVGGGGGAASSWATQPPSRPQLLTLVLEDSASQGVMSAAVRIPVLPAPLCAELARLSPASRQGVLSDMATLLTLLGHGRAAGAAPPPIYYEACRRLEAFAQRKDLAGLAKAARVLAADGQRLTVLRRASLNPLTLQFYDDQLNKDYLSDSLRRLSLSDFILFVGLQLAAVALFSHQSLLSAPVKSLWGLHPLLSLGFCWFFKRNPIVRSYPALSLIAFALSAAFLHAQALSLPHLTCQPDLSIAARLMRCVPASLVLQLAIGLALRPPFLLYLMNVGCCVGLFVWGLRMSAHCLVDRSVHPLLLTASLGAFLLPLVPHYFAERRQRMKYVASQN